MQYYTIIKYMIYTIDYKLFEIKNINITNDNFRRLQVLKIKQYLYIIEG